MRQPRVKKQDERVPLFEMPQAETAHFPTADVDPPLESEPLPIVAPRVQTKTSKQLPSHLAAFLVRYIPQESITVPSGLIPTPREYVAAWLPCKDIDEAAKRLQEVDDYILAKLAHTG
jgi:hypothetical protein